MRNLREKTGESVNLAILRGESVIYLNSLESSSTIKVTAPLGKRVPAHACVEGRALLAFSEPNMLESVIRAGLAAPPPQAIIDLESLRAELALIRERGYALGNEEATIGVRAIAAPFFGSDNDVVGAIGIAGPTTRLSLAQPEVVSADVERQCRSLIQPAGRAPRGRHARPQLAAGSLMIAPDRIFAEHQHAHDIGDDHYHDDARLRVGP